MRRTTGNERVRAREGKGSAVVPNLFFLSFFLHTAEGHRVGEVWRRLYGQTVRGPSIRRRNSAPGSFWLRRNSRRELMMDRKKSKTFYLAYFPPFPSDFRCRRQQFLLP